MQKHMISRAVLFWAILTCASLACQAGNLVSTATPTSTITPSPTLTPTATATSLPTSTPSSEVSLETQEDGSELFIDPQAGFSLLIPSTWAGIPANMDDLSPYVEKVSEENPQFNQALSLLKNMDPNILRIMAMDTNADHYTDSYVPNFTVVSLEDPLSARMSLEKVVQMIKSSISSQYPGAELLNSGVETVNSNFSYGYNELKLPVKAQDGTNVRVFQKQTYFSIGDYFIIITLSAPDNPHEEVLLEFNSILETVQLLNR